jgi:hypothetical protein
MQARVARGDGIVLIAPVVIFLGQALEIGGVFGSCPKVV